MQPISRIFFYKTISIQHLLLSLSLWQPLFCLPKFLLLYSFCVCVCVVLYWGLNPGPHTCKPNALYHWAIPPALFGDKVSLNLPGWPWSSDSLVLASFCITVRSPYQLRNPKRESGLEHKPLMLWVSLKYSLTLQSICDMIYLSQVCQGLLCAVLTFDPHSSPVSE